MGLGDFAFVHLRLQPMVSRGTQQEPLCAPKCPGQAGQLPGSARMRQTCYAPKPNAAADTLQHEVTSRWVRSLAWTGCQTRLWQGTSDGCRRQAERVAARNRRADRRISASRQQAIDRQPAAESGCAQRPRRRRNPGTTPLYSVIVPGPAPRRRPRHPARFAIRSAAEAVHRRSASCPSRVP